jgi:hypothetical protein
VRVGISASAAAHAISAAGGQYECATGDTILPGVLRGPASARTTSRMSRRGTVGWHMRLTRPIEAPRDSGEAERVRGGLDGRSAS